MYVIAGLGNPGKKYENTPHNMGFITVDHIAEKLGVKIDKIKFKGLIAETNYAGSKVILLKPQTFMNLSGQSIREIMNFYKPDIENLIVIYDDIDIEVGKLRVRSKGSAGSHNGMRDIIYQLGEDGFPRIRVGIKSSRSQKMQLRDYVTGDFAKEDVSPLEEAVEKAAQAALCFIDEGIDKAMNKYNVKKEKKEKPSDNKEVSSKNPQKPKKSQQNDLETENESVISRGERDE